MTRMPDIVDAEFKRWFMGSGFVILFLPLSGCDGAANITTLTQQCASCHGVGLEGGAQWKIQNIVRMKKSFRIQRQQSLQKN